MIRAVRAEWTKLRTTRGPAWLLLVTAIVTVALGAAVSAAADCAQTGCDAGRLVLSGVYLGQASVAVLAVMAVSGEYSNSLIRTTLTAMPRRSTVLAAKAVVLTVAVGVIASLTVFASVLLGRVVLPHVVSLAGGAVVRAAVGSVAYLVLLAILSVGVAAIVRDSAVAIGTVLGLLYLPPILTQLVSDPELHRLLEQLAPMTAGLSVQATTDLGQPIGPWAGLGVLAAWSAAMLLAGTLLLSFRDT